MVEQAYRSLDEGLIPGFSLQRLMLPHVFPAVAMKLQSYQLFHLLESLRKGDLGFEAVRLIEMNHLCLR
jgi:hypothetical protein